MYNIDIVVIYVSMHTKWNKKKYGKIYLHGLGKMICDNTILERITYKTNSDDSEMAKLLASRNNSENIICTFEHRKWLKSANKYFYFTVYHCPFDRMNG